MFNPVRSHLLYASFRRHDFIYVWDLRGDVSNPMQRFKRFNHPEQPGEVTQAESNSKTQRNVEETNQRLRFDIDAGGNWMAIGNQVECSV